MQQAGQPRSERIAWVDYAKGWSIIMVVTMHSALGVGLAVGAQGWMHEVVAFAKPFRMPDFFLVAGLFAAPALKASWRKFFDRKVLHFTYFYALWLLIELGFKAREIGIASPIAFTIHYLYGFIQPFSSMWFIQILPIFFVCARLIQRLPAVLTLGGAAATHTLAAASPDGGVYAMGSNLTGWVTLDSFLLYFIYFLAGVLFSRSVFAFARWACERPLRAGAALLAWAVVEEILVKTRIADIAGPTLVAGFAGAFAVVCCSSLLARARLGDWLAYCGRHSLVVYLGFFVPMAATRIALTKTGLIPSVGWISLAVACAGVCGPLVLDRLVANTPFKFLFVRPQWARLRDREGPMRPEPELSRERRAVQQTGRKAA